MEIYIFWQKIKIFNLLSTVQVDECAPELSQVTFEDKREREVPVEVELVELTTSVNESLQFPELEEILDSGKTSEISEVSSKVIFCNHCAIKINCKLKAHLDATVFII